MPQVISGIGVILLKSADICLVFNLGVNIMQWVIVVPEMNCYTIGPFDSFDEAEKYKFGDRLEEYMFIVLLQTPAKSTRHVE